MRNSCGKARSLRVVLHGAAIIAILFGALATPASSAQHRYSVKIHNSSKFTVARLYVQNAELGNWGPDEMKSFVLSPGKTFTLTNIKPGEYNIKFVDGKGRDCILQNYAITRNHTWELTTTFLQKCRSFS